MRGQALQGRGERASHSPAPATRRRRLAPRLACRAARSLKALLSGVRTHSASNAVLLAAATNMGTSDLTRQETREAPGGR